MSQDGITLGLDGVRLDASLAVPPAARGLVLFAHGSGRHSPRNGQVARALQGRGLATLLVDLLTPAEARVVVADAGLGFDVDFLADRLVAATDWARRDARTAHLAPCYFGASTGAAAALIAAARRPAEIRAVVSRGGRPDLAEASLPAVRAPTLFIVGGEDVALLAASRPALQRLAGARQLVVVAGASHLFAEPGAIEQVGQLAADWFVEHLGPAIEARSALPR